MKISSPLLLIFLFICALSGAQTINRKYKLPGKGLKQYDFLYVGEWDMRNPKAQSMFVVHGGKVVWQYSIPQFTATGHIQEFDDCTMLAKGNIVYACMSGDGIFTPKKNIIWQYICFKAH